MDHIDDGKVWAIDDRTKTKRRVSPRTLAHKPYLRPARGRQAPRRNQEIHEVTRKQDVQCTATTTSGNRCKRPASADGVCSIHTPATKPEPENPNTEPASQPDDKKETPDA